MSVKVHCAGFSRRLEKGVSMEDVTGELARIVAESGVKDGRLTATVIGSTGSLTTIEYEPGVVSDLCRAIDRIAPPHIEYMHELAWNDGNGHSHVGAAVIGPSIALPVRGGALKLGTWQQAVLINHDPGPRNREVEVTVIGEG